MMVDAKKQLRQAMKKARGEFASDPARRRAAEKAINETLLSLLEAGDNELPDAVFLYRAFGAEVSLDRLEKELLEKGIPAALPRIGADGSMVFHRFHEGDALVRHAFGMEEPLESAPVMEASERTFIIVPGLAFDRTGARLGYGGGFYDRYLSAHPQAKTVMAAFAVQETDQVPSDIHDRWMDAVVTEKELVRIDS